MLQYFCRKLLWTDRMTSAYQQTHYLGSTKHYTPGIHVWFTSENIIKKKLKGKTLKFFLIQPTSIITVGNFWSLSNFWQHSYLSVMFLRGKYSYTKLSACWWTVNCMGKRYAVNITSIAAVFILKESNDTNL